MKDSQTLLVIVLTSFVHPSIQQATSCPNDSNGNPVQPVNGACPPANTGGSTSPIGGQVNVAALAGGIAGGVGLVAALAGGIYARNNIINGKIQRVANRPAVGENIIQGDFNRNQYDHHAEIARMNEEATPGDKLPVFDHLGQPVMKHNPDGTQFFHPELDAHGQPVINPDGTPRLSRRGTQLKLKPGNAERYEVISDPTVQATLGATALYDKTVEQDMKISEGRWQKIGAPAFVVPTDAQLSGPHVDAAGNPITQMAGFKKLPPGPRDDHTLKILQNDAAARGGTANPKIPQGGYPLNMYNYDRIPEGEVIRLSPTQNDAAANVGIPKEVMKVKQGHWEKEMPKAERRKDYVGSFIRGTPSTQHHELVTGSQEGLLEMHDRLQAYALLSGNYKVPSPQNAKTENDRLAAIAAKYTPQSTADPRPRPQADTKPPKVDADGAKLTAPMRRFRAKVQKEGVALGQYDSPSARTHVITADQAAAGRQGFMGIPNITAKKENQTVLRKKCGPPTPAARLLRRLVKRELCDEQPKAEDKLHDATKDLKIAPGAGNTAEQAAAKTAEETAAKLPGRTGLLATAAAATMASKAAQTRKLQEEKNLQTREKGVEKSVATTGKKIEGTEKEAAAKVKEAVNPAAYEAANAQHKVANAAESTARDLKPSTVGHTAEEAAKVTSSHLSEVGMGAATAASLVKSKLDAQKTDAEKKVEGATHEAEKKVGGTTEATRDATHGAQTAAQAVEKRKTNDIRDFFPAAENKAKTAATNLEHDASKATHDLAHPGTTETAARDLGHTAEHLKGGTLAGAGAAAAAALAKSKDGKIDKYFPAAEPKVKKEASAAVDKTKEAASKVTHAMPEKKQSTLDSFLHKAENGVESKAKGELKKAENAVKHPGDTLQSAEHTLEHKGEDALKMAKENPLKFTGKVLEKGAEAAMMVTPLGAGREVATLAGKELLKTTVGKEAEGAAKKEGEKLLAEHAPGLTKAVSKEEHNLAQGAKGLLNKVEGKGETAASKAASSCRRMRLRLLKREVTACAFDPAKSAAAKAKKEAEAKGANATGELKHTATNLSQEAHKAENTVKEVTTKEKGKIGKTIDTLFGKTKTEKALNAATSVPPPHSSDDKTKQQQQQKTTTNSSAASTKSNSTTASIKSTAASVQSKVSTAATSVSTAASNAAKNIKNTATNLLDKAKAAVTPKPKELEKKTTTPPPPPPPPPPPAKKTTTTGKR